MLSQIFLAPLAGLVVVTAGFQAGFALNALFYLLSALVLRGLTVPRLVAGGERRHLLRDAADGAQYLLRDPAAASARVVQLLAALSAEATSALLVVYAREALDVTDPGYGALLAAIGVGAALGPLGLLRFVTSPRRPGHLGALPHDGREPAQRRRTVPQPATGLLLRLRPSPGAAEPEGHRSRNTLQSCAIVRRMRIPAALQPAMWLCVATLTLTGCSSTPASGDQQVLAAESVFVDAPTVVADVSGTFATLRVDTGVDMACAVVFGTDQSLGGGIATDADMGGGAHTDHEAVMAGLEPDTEYFFRVQGSGADGNLYRSELMTFRTPRADATATPGQNVAVGAEVVDVSSEFSDAFPAAYAVDGDPTTAWSSAGDGDDASITIDLGRPVTAVGVALRSRSMTDGTAVVERYTVTVDDGDTYGPFEAGTTMTVNEVDFTGQVLRIDAEETTGGNTGAAEIEVYGAS